MAEFQSGFQKYFILIGVAGIFGVHYGMSRAHSYHKLQNQERDVAGLFKSFKRLDGGTKMPEIRVVSPSGTVVDLSNTGGDYVVLNVWATWCAPCVKELPALQSLDLFLNRKGGWKVMAVSIDSEQNLKKMFGFTKRLGVSSLANYNDHNLELQKVMNVTRLPTTFIVGANGSLLYEIQGEARWYDVKILSFLELVKKVR